ncbi:MAG: FMN-dependent NADH-azoreductase [Anaerolineae bacterium]
MAKVLYIKANAKPRGFSRTFAISDAFIEEYRKIHPQDEITTLDLYQENIHFLTEDDINAVFGPKTEEARKLPILKYAYQFADADKYVIAEPMWNLNIPAILVAYIDYISVKDIAFKYTAQGSVGLLKDKKAVNIVSRGGDYCTPPFCEFEMGDRYLKTIFAFFGITDFTTIFADKLDIVGENVEAIVDNAIKEAKEIAKTF